MRRPQKDDLPLANGETRNAMLDELLQVCAWLSWRRVEVKGRRDIRENMVKTDAA
jgi:hypothetical protein